MPIRYTKARVHFEERCAVEEALELVAFLGAHPRTKIVLAKCTGMHSALVQVLLAFRPTILPGVTAPAIARLFPASCDVPLVTASSSAQEQQCPLPS
jgi:hypothetical protein